MSDSADPSRSVSERRLAAIVFTDVVGYSARMQQDEAGTMALVAADFALMGERCTRHGGELLNSMGDGLLLSFNSAVQAVACALQIQAEFAARREKSGSGQMLEHRMGVHIGDVFRQQTGGVAGDGVNIAARLEGKAPVGGVCISQMVYDTVKGKVPMQALFIGPETFKNITEPIPIWHVSAAGGPTPTRPPMPVTKPKRRPLAQAVAVIAVGLVVTAVIWPPWEKAKPAANPATTAGPADESAFVPNKADDKPAPPEKSVAVLPFANLSGDKEQEYFSDGLTEEILNALSRERDLLVPGRTSSFFFKGKDVSLAEIARALNVSRLVEGSVRKAGTKVRISVSLTRAAEGFSEELGTFTEELSDLFNLQDKVARAVVEKLTRRTSTVAVVALTKNAEAYDAYLKGRALQTRSADISPAAAKFYEQAVALDPAFALAWARLAAARIRASGAQSDRSPEAVNGARAAIDRALEVQPDLPDALIARANWLRQEKFDYLAAQRDLARAETLQPATAELRAAQANVARDLGHWPDVFRLYREALRLDPQNGDFTNILAVGVCLPRGEYKEADQLLKRAMVIQGPGVATPLTNLIITRTLWRGPAAALRLLDRMPAGQAGVSAVRANLLLALGRVDDARVVIDEMERAAGVGGSAATMGNQGSRASPEQLLAVGREQEARQRAEEIRSDATQQLARGNRAPLVRTAFIRAETILGRRDSALAALQEWREEAQRMPSAFRRMSEFTTVASALYARLGQADEAVALLQELLTNGYRTRYGLRSNLDFEFIRADPRFQEALRQADAFAQSLPDPVDL